MRAKTRYVVTGLSLCATAAMVAVGHDVLAQSGPVRTVTLSREWPTYGHDPGGMRFSPLDADHARERRRLEVAWTYHMKPPVEAAPPAAAPEVDAAADAAARASRRAKSRRSSSTGRCTSQRRITASWPWMPTTGKEMWAFRLAVWKSVDARRRILARRCADAGADRLRFERRQAVLARREDREPNEAFGDKGVVELGYAGNPARPPRQRRTELAARSSTGTWSSPAARRRRTRPGGRRVTSARGTCTPASSPGRFDSIPRAGEKYNDTWAGDSWKNRSGVNVWGFLTVDVQRGIVYMPFGAPSVDQYGGDREGDNLFGNSLVAADAKTGKYLWHFQIVHHDIWDADLSPRAGARRREAGRHDHPGGRRDQQDGSAVPARSRDRQADLRRRGAAGAAKRGAAGTRGEDAAVPAQAAAALAHDDDAADIATVTPELEAACRKLIEGMQLGGPYLPPCVQPFARAVPRQPRRRQLGRDVVQSAARLPVRQHERTGTDHRTDVIAIRTRPVRRVAKVKGTASIRTGRIRACRVADASRTTPRT